MLLIVMDTPAPEGWSDVKYKSFRARDDYLISDDDTGSDDDSSVQQFRGYTGHKYKKILIVEDLIPE